MRAPPGMGRGLHLMSVEGPDVQLSSEGVAHLGRGSGNGKATLALRRAA